MARTLTPVIDCLKTPDLLGGWEALGPVQASATAQAILSDLEASWTLEAADLEGAGWHLDADACTITLDTAGLSQAALARSPYFQNAILMDMFAALRAAWQAERVVAARALHQPVLWPFLGRLFAADTAVMAVRMAAELREEGNDALWRHVLGGEYGDMANAYLCLQERALFTPDDRAALSAIFFEWFAKEPRVNAADAETLADMDDHALVAEGRDTVTFGAIRCLTIDPVSCGSYLGAEAAEIAGNHAWRTITDPLNAAHFQHILSDMDGLRVGGIRLQDKKLAARLFPDEAVQA